MAMTIRFSTETDQRLEALAKTLHTSKQQIIERAVEEHLTREYKRQIIEAALEETSKEYAGLLKRLEDA